MKFDEILKERYPNESTRTLSEELGISIKYIYNRVHVLNITKTDEYYKSEKSGRYPPGWKGGISTQFKKGHSSFNKGMKMSAELYEKVKPTMFKKGNRPHNWKPDGTIEPRYDKSGKTYLYIKIKDSHWVLYHRYVWEKEVGEIPKGLIVSFKDKNFQNCDINNLELISRVDNMNRNTIQRYPQELQQVIKLKCKLIKKIEKNGTQQVK